MKYLIGFALAMPLVCLVAIAVHKNAEAEFLNDPYKQCKKVK